MSCVEHFFSLTVAAIAVTAVAVALLAAFFTKGLNTHPENQVAVEGGFNFFNMVDGITKVGDVHSALLLLLLVELLLLEEEEKEEDDEY